MSLVIVMISVQGTASAASDITPWFQRTEQSLMDPVATGDRVLDPSLFVVTSEAGEVIPREQFLAELRRFQPV